MAKDILIDPENGGVLGIALLMSKKIVAPIDIRSWTIEGVKVVDESAIIERDEIIRLHDFSKDRVRIFAKPVMKEDGKILGIVHDFVIDTEVGQLKQIYVAKKLLFFTLEKRIIDYREIIEIKEDRIIVKNDLAESKQSIKDFFALKRSVNMKAAA